MICLDDMVKLSRNFPSLFNKNNFKEECSDGHIKFYFSMHYTAFIQVSLRSSTGEGRLKWGFIIIA